jgi:hypothetical protein
VRVFFCNVASAVVIIALAASASLLLAQESTDPERATAVQRQPPTRYQGTISREGRQLGAPARTFGQSAGPEAPSEDPTSAIGITLWCLTIGEPAEPPTDEFNVNVQDRIDDLPSTFKSADEVREFVGRLKVAGMLRTAREIHLTTIDGQQASTQSNRNQPRIVATQIIQGAERAPVMNSVQMEQVGTILQTTPRIDSEGALKVNLDYSSSELEEDPTVVIAEIPGREPVMAQRVKTQQVKTLVRLRSGTAVLVQQDQDTAAGNTPLTRMTILAASILEGDAQ